jgi:hypothetical protein
MIHAMSGFMTFLVIVALLAVVLEYSRRRRNLFEPTPGSDRSVDRDRDRVVADLQARGER